MVVKDDSPLQNFEFEFSPSLIGDLFTAQAAATPHAPAVVWDGAELTYAELENAANRLAGRLAGLGVSREDRVGLLAERSAGQVIAVLAVLKAGAAYLPLDTRAPAGRMRQLLTPQARPRVVLCDQGWRATAAGLHEGPTVLVDTAGLLAGGGPAGPPPVTGDLGDLAYVIFTSGSTGQPKAVAVRHQDVAALAADHRFSAGAHQRVLLHSPLAFDASTYELWVPLLSGGTLVMAPPGDLDPAAVRQVITGHKVTALWLTSGLFRMLAQDAPDCLAGAREVWTGGDVVPAAAVRRVLAACPALTVTDGYGPTETTTFATSYPMPTPEAVPDAVPIGSPLDNMQVYILDRDLRPVPPGIPGHLHIAGAGLARGYLDQPGLTAQKFISCPYGPPGSRMYATGDLARWTSTGQIDFSGRADHQVKIRGFRIEPAEIEAALTAHPAIADAAVIAREDTPGRKHLAAYIVPATSSPATGSPATGDLRDHLAAILPDYMIPATFTTLDALPLTPSGKLDRHALPVPTWSSATDGDYVAPRTDAERVVSRICADVLGLDHIGIHDNFFELGGDSILSIDVAFRIGETFGVRLPARAVFDARTPARLAELLPAQARPGEGGREGGCGARIVPSPRTGTQAVPLSAAQRRLWFLDDLTSGGIEYNTGIGVRLSGRLDVGALQEALDALVSRHESLRTTFDNVDGRGMQVIAAEGDIPLRVLDMSAIHDDRRDAAVERALANELTLSFNLRRGPLIRVTLLRLADDDHILLLCQHHIITDGWSVKVLVDELAELYSASVRGRAAILPDLPIQYADFALWQGEQLAGPALDVHLDYWGRKLADLEPLELPTDRPRPPVRTTAGAIYRHDLPADLVERLTRTGQSRSATLFMTLAAAVQLLLSRYAGRRDVAIGTATSGRTRDELKDLVGFFVNTVVLRSQVDDTATVGEFLSQVRETALEAFAHDEAPFDRVVERVQPERDAGRTPLIQAMIVLQNAIVRPRTAGGVRFSPHHLPRPAARFDVVFEFIPCDGSLNLAIEYNTDLFDTATVERMARHLQVLLAAIAADPGQLVGGIELATPAEQAQVLAAGTGPAGEVPAGTFAELFQAQAARTPDATALAAGPVRLSYAELNTRANQLARHLAAAGAAPERLIALALPRTAEMVTAILAVLKTGAAYLPVDPALPPGRIGHLLTDAQPVLIITTAVTDLPATATPRLHLDDPDTITALTRHPGTDLADTDRAAPLHPAHPAYVIYTSGSTGTPKGVVVSHIGLVNLHIAQRQGFLAPAGRRRLRAALTASFSFDPSWEGLLLLASGHELHLIDEQMRADPAALVQYTADQRIDIVNSTPSYLEQLLAAGLLAQGRHRPGIILTAGEPVPGHLWQALGAAPGTASYNLYGPTEATIEATSCPITGTRPGIGRPLENMRVYVLDPALHLAPEGVPGELYLAGAGLARGYLNQPGLTAQRFIACPYGPPSSRMYATGDLARWTGGTLEYLGRVDEQVKIRGFRIEPGEIETALTAHPAIADAAVIARADTPGRRQLAAYLIPASGTAGVPSAAELRGWLAATLPDYMIPAAFTVLDALPLTPSGKLDRRALPAPDRDTATAGHVPPRTPAEQAIAAIWADVLGISQVGIHDNFFELGGDSILSIQIVSSSRQAGLSMESQDIFRHQTIAELASKTVAPAASSAAGQGLVSGPVNGPVPLTPVQRWFLESGPTRPEHFDQWMALELASVPDPAVLEAALGALIAHHDALRMRFTRAGGGWEQDNLLPGPAAGLDVLDCCDVSGISDPGQQQAAIDELAGQVHAGFDLAAGPLLRAVLFDRGRQRRPVLLLAVHHLVTDAVSWRILLEDLATACQQAAAGTAVDLGPKTTSFRDWALRLDGHARTGGFDGELAWWEHHAASPAAALPTDSGEPNTVASTGSVTVTLTPDRTRALLQQVPAAYRTQINDVLLTALSQVLGRWAGQDQVLIDLEGHGREEDRLPGTDLSRTVGWFTTIYPVVLTAIPSEGWGEALKSVKEQLRAIPGRGLGYGALRYLADHSELASQPTVSFNYLGQLDRAVPAVGLVHGIHHGLDASASPAADRPHQLDIVARIQDHCLQLTWTYSAGLHQQATITALAEAMIAALDEIITHCTTPGTGGRTPSDYPLARLDQATTDQLAGNGHTIDDIYPLTPMQAGMTFHSLSRRDQDVYLEQTAFILDGVTDPGVLAAAWQHVTSRTPVLRTAIIWENVPHPVQVVHHAAALPVTRLDWTTLDGPARHHALTRYLDHDRDAGLDLTTPPLMRLAIARLTPTPVHLSWTFHHLLLDGWSVFHVLADVYAAHAALTAGHTPPPTARPPFRDYLDWLARQDPAQAETYWRGALAGFHTPTPLPYDRPPAHHHTAQSAQWHPAALDQQDSARLHHFAHTHSLTLNTLLQGAWALLLSRYTGHHDIIFGATVSGRPADLPGASDITGIFINTLPVRAQITSTSTVTTWLQTLQTAQAEARQHHATALTQVQAWTDIPDGTSLFDSIVVFENYPVNNNAATAHGLHMHDLDAREKTSYPLTLAASPGPPLTYAIGYDPALFDSATVERMAGHLQVLLTAIAANPDQPAGTIELTTPAEREQLLTTWNNTTRPVPPATLNELVTTQARQTPHAPAVITDSGQLTYAELDAAASQLARRLAGLGVGREDRVAVLADRSAEQVIAVLAVIKAGAAYLPLDTRAPAARMRQLLTQAGAHMVLCDQAWQATAAW